MKYFFFFQGEDGIRDDLVTGVQTCALPISKISFTMRSCCLPSIDLILIRSEIRMGIFTRSCETCTSRKCGQRRRDDYNSCRFWIMTRRRLDCGPPIPATRFTHKMSYAVFVIM